MFGNHGRLRPWLDLTALRPATEEQLGGFLRRIAGDERQALADLYVCLGQETLDVLGRDLADPVEARQILRATFLEVWLTAGHRPCAIKAREWVLMIANRRSADRLLVSAEVGRNPLLVSIRDTIDEQITIEFEHLVRRTDRVSVR